MDFEMSNGLQAGAVAANVNGATRYYHQLPNASVDFSHVSPSWA